MQATRQDIPLSMVASTVKQKCPTVLFISQTFLLIAKLIISLMQAGDDSVWLGGVSVAQCSASENTALHRGKGWLSRHHSGSGFGPARFPSVFLMQMWNKESSEVFHK